MYDFKYIPGQGLKVNLCRIPEDELEKLMKQDKRDEANQEDLDFLEECKSDQDDWDRKNLDYL